MPNNESQFWSKISKIYEDKFMDQTIYDESYGEFCNQILPTGEILEIGCGPGNIAKKILKKRPDLKWLGTDYAQKMVDLAVINNPDARFKVLDAKKLYELNKQFDGIIAGFILPFFKKEEVEILFKNVSRLLKNEGVFYLSFVVGDHADSEFKKSNTGDKLFFRYFEREYIEEQFNQNGLKLIKEYVVEFPRGENEVEKHTILLAKKRKEI
jgi:SAM-dependent methyltransferase